MSFAVSFSRHSVDLRVRCYDTDAQNLASLLLFVVTPPSNRSHGVQGSRVERRTRQIPPSRLMGA